MTNQINLNRGTPIKSKKAIKIKKSFSILAIIFLFLSNIAIAQYSSGSSDSSLYEGRPIDGSREGTDYYKEGRIIIYKGDMGSKEKEMMERFMGGGIGEDEMRDMAKAKFGDRFSEMEFQKGMLELKERMERKGAFSYEHEGFGQGYDAGPSYEGYPKEHMVFGMIFEHIGDDIDPREIKQYCGNPEKIAGIITGKLTEKLGDLQKICSRMDEEESKCAESANKGCSQIGTAFVREDATEIEKIQSVAYSCPVNKDAIIEACKKRSIFHMEQRLQNLEDNCKKRFDFEGERLIRECERFRESNICDKERFIERCMGGIKKDDFKTGSGRGSGFQYAQWQCYDGSAESHSDSSCKSSEAWSEFAKDSCESRCNDDKSKCGVNSFSVSGECRHEVKNEVKKEACPAYPVPDCGKNSILKTNAGANGCVSYYCEPLATAACPADVQQCPDGSYVKRALPGCDFEPCPAITAQCPYASLPTCQTGTTIEKHFDDKGCVYYNCKTITCSEIAKPGCNSDETLQAYYDNAGCVTGYRCIRQQTCPIVVKPACGEGQSLTTKYDDRGCVAGYECISVAAASDVPKITGNVVNVVLRSYDDFLRQCENSWQEQERMCSAMQSGCDRDSFIDKCKEQERRNYDDFKSKIGQHCESETIPEMMHAEQRCSRIDEDRQRCYEESGKRCGHMKGMAQQCRDSLNEEKLRSFIINEAKKRCRFTDMLPDKDDLIKSEKAEIVLAVLNTATSKDIEKLELFVDGLKEDLKLQDTTVYRGTIEPNRFGDIKLLPFVVNAKISAFASSEMAKETKARIVAGQNFEDAAGRLISLRDSDVPSEYLYIIEDKASNVLDVSEELNEIEKKDEQKGLGYKIRLFLGMAKKAEEEEIRQLRGSMDKLSASVEALGKLAEEVPSDVAKAILKEQVENLKKQQEEIEVLIEVKAGKANGFFGLFG